MAHKQLPLKLAHINSMKMKQNDVTSLKDIILDKAQDVLDELEGTTSLQRMNYRPQQNRPQQGSSSQFRDNRHSARPDLRSSGTARQRTPTPTKAPRHPDSYCLICLRDPQRKHLASTHFLRECRLLPQGERDYLRRIFEKALQKRTLPRDKWPPKIYGDSGPRVQTFNLKLVNMVEDFYDLELTDSNTASNVPDYFDEDNTKRI